MEEQITNLEGSPDSDGSGLLDHRESSEEPPALPEAASELRAASAKRIPRIARRAIATLRTAIVVLFTEGPGVFAAVSGRWLRGERGYWRGLARRRESPVAGGERSFASSSLFARPAITDPALIAFSLREEPGDPELLRQIQTSKRWAVRPGFDLVSHADSACAADIQATFDSLRQQTYRDWTWHVAMAQLDRPSALALEDDRVQLFDPSERTDGGIPGLRDFVVPLKPGDLLAPDALYAAADLVRRHPETALVFADEDRLDGEGRREKPFFKPDWSPELALSVDLSGGFAAFQRVRIPVTNVGPWDHGFGAWETSLSIGFEAGEIRHVPRILCHRKSRRDLDRTRPDAAAAMLARSLKRSGVSRPEVVVADRRGRSCLRLRWSPAGNRLASIVIPSRTPTLAARCLGSLLGRGQSTRLEVIVVMTGGRAEAWESLRETTADSRVQFFRFEPAGDAFNFQKACNAGRAQARGDALLFLNDDIFVGEDEWLIRLLQWLDLDRVGAVGPKLLYPDGRIQHAGAVVGMTGFAAHVFREEIEGVSSCFVSDEWYRNCSALTAACLLVRSEAFDRTGGFDERFTLLFGDVDLCLRLRADGWRLVYTPDVRLVHAESSTRRARGSDRIPRSDWELLTRLWQPALRAGDPFYNPNLSVRVERPEIRSGPDDTAIRVHEEWMERLPRKPMITFPDDLFGIPDGESRP